MNTSHMRLVKQGISVIILFFFLKIFVLAQKCQENFSLSEIIKNQSSEKSRVNLLLHHIFQLLFCLVI